MINIKKLKRITLVLLVLISSLPILNGCIKNEYKEFTVKFDNTYLEITKTIDITNTITTLTSIQSEENKNRIEELRILLENIQNKVPESKIDQYERYYIESYKGLVLLRDTPYTEWDKLSFKQKSDVWSEIGLMNIRND